MSSYSLLSASAVVACCLLACHAESDGFTPSDAGGAEPEAGGAPSPSGHAGRGGSAGAGRHGVTQTAAGDGGDDDDDDGAAGEASDAGGSAGGTNSAGAPPAPANEIPADAGAGPVATDCTTEQTTCTVLGEPACEFMAYAGAAKTVSCGQTVAVGTTACGGCGFVTVKLFFDGRYCWQGVPECELSDYASKFVYPHLP